MADGCGYTYGSVMKTRVIKHALTSISYTDGCFPIPTVKDIT